MSFESERAYLDDPYRVDFEARVIGEGEHGGRSTVVLDRTWFYPEGGGQPADRGRIGDSAVLDVQVVDGRIHHVLDRPLAAGSHAATIDWERRFDHMQQHSGQHLLSRCFIELCGADTVSFHLGDTECSIDLEHDAVADGIPERAEALAQRIVFDNRPVEQSVVDRQAALEMAGDVPDKAADRVRVVVIRDFDTNPCGGTHVTRTGEIGPVKIRRVERSRGRLRVGFLCGWRAIRDYRWRHDGLRALALDMTAGEDEVLGLVTQRLDERRELERRVRRLLGEVASSRATKLVDAQRVVGRFRVVRTMVEDGELAKPLARALVATPGIVALVGATGEPARLVFAASDDVTLDAGVLMRESARRIGGGGGGRGGWAEGAGPDASGLEAALDHAEGMLTAVE